MTDSPKLQPIIRPSASELADIRIQVEALKQLARSGELQRQIEAARQAQKAFQIARPSFPSLAAVKSLLKQARESREALADWAKLRRTIPAARWGVPALGPASIAAAAQQAAEIRDRLRPYQRPLVEAFALEERKGLNEAISRAGWLPHATNPPVPAEKLSPTELSALFDAHYQSEWPSVRMQLEQTASDSQVDDEAKAAFSEALEAHEKGLYRAACRTLLLEIERVARAEFGPRIRGNPIKEMKKAFGDLPLSCFGGPAGARIVAMRRFTTGLYKQVNSEQDVIDVAADQVPNRHACVHGQVSYSSRQNSINVLLMTEFVFAMLTEMRFQHIAAQAVDLAS